MGRTSSEPGERTHRRHRPSPSAYLRAIARGNASDARTFGILFGILIDKADKLTGADTAATDEEHDPVEVRASAHEFGSNLVDLVEQLANGSRRPDDPPGMVRLSDLREWFIPKV